MKRYTALLVSAFLLLLLPAAAVLCQEKEEPAWNPRFLKPIDIGALTVGKLRKIATLTERQTRGFLPVLLAWSPDDASLFIVSHSVETDKGQSGFLFEAAHWVEKPSPFRNYFSVPISGEEIEEEKKAPGWVLPYWNFKSFEASLDGAKITKEMSKRQQSVYRLSGIIVGRPWKLKGGSDSGQWFSAAAYLYPGFTYSWSPPGGKAIAFVDEYKIFLMTEDGKDRRKIAKGDLILPAWSNLGNRIAFLNMSLGGAWNIHVVELAGIRYK